MTKAAIVKDFHSRHRVFGKIVFVLVGILACAGIAYGVGVFILVNAIFGLFGGASCEANPVKVESIAHIKLPPSAKVVWSSCGGLQGIWAEVHFDMTPADLEAFVNSTNVELPLSSTVKPEKLECAAAICKHVLDVSSYFYGTYSADEWFEEIFIDTSNPSLYRVYFTLLAG